ncbi:hypothetical protein J1N35_022076 [Gossypium stocksii]|uniref:Uncharacterized protein n=1 Tax=Gossypium stocksii TaxID=47602 RepID=A0A9D4A2L4_9ROSI|nr:hypothetical protein J1N35_022076 [Gossypium stocksii]
MYRKRTRSSKTTPENSILINEEEKERFNSIFKHQPMMPEKGFNLKSHDLMVVFVPIRKKINALKWERFCDTRSFPDDELCYDKFRIPIDYKRVWEPFLPKGILKPIAKIWFYFVRYSFMPISHSSTISIEQKSINVGKIILKEIHDCAKKRIGRCITNHDLERLVEKVHELNQGEQEEPTKLDTEESTNETETNVNSITDTEEEESDEEPNSPKQVEGSTNLEPKVEPEYEIVKLSVKPEFTTPVPTSTSTSKKS